MKPRLANLAAALAAVLAAALPAAARAGNGDLPRTPTIHLGERCLTVVDRSVDPVVHLDYTIPNNDICLTADELAGSRTHQLVAFCHGDPPARIVPHWHSRAEADAGAVALDCSADPGVCLAGEACEAGRCRVQDSDILAEHPDYAGCWTAIVPAEDRRPITCAAARPGVDWDTTGLARGTYLVRGYTYEPPLNFWAPRRGLFKIVDGPDPADAPPAVAIGNLDAYLWKDQPLALHLCVDAMDGSTVTISHAISVAEADPQPDWTVALADEPVATGDVVLEFTPPAAVGGQFLTVRAEIVDPMDRRFTAYMQADVKVELVEDPAGGTTTATTGDDDTGDPDTGDASPTFPAPDYDFCAENPDADKLPECPDPTSGGSSDETGAPETGAGGCCNIQGPPSPAALLVLLALRRRRRAAA